MPKLSRSPIASSLAGAVSVAIYGANAAAVNARLMWFELDYKVPDYKTNV